MAKFSKILSLRTVITLLAMQVSFLVPSVAKGADTAMFPIVSQDGQWTVVTLAQESEGSVIESAKVSKGMVAWTEVRGNERRLYVFDGTVERQLAAMSKEIWDRDADNGFFDAVTGNYDVADGRVVWIGTDGLDREVYEYAGGRTSLVSDNTYDDRHPVTGRGRVAWTSQPSSAYNLMVKDAKGARRLDSWHVPNYAFSDGNLYWLNRLSTENWFRVFVNGGSQTTAIGQADDRPVSQYFLTDGKGSAAWEYSTKQWSYDKRRTYVSVKGAQAVEVIQRDVPPNVTYLEDTDGGTVLMNVHDLLTTMMLDYQFQVVNGSTIRTVTHEIAPSKARFMDSGYIRHLVAENGSPLTFTRSDGTGESQISLDRIVFDAFDADGPTAAGAVMGGGVLTYRDGVVKVLETSNEASGVIVGEGDIAWTEGTSGVRKLSFATKGVLVKSASGAKIVSGTLVKTGAYSSVYLAATDGKRYAFPNEGQFFSWYKDFDSLQVLSAADLAKIPLAGNVLYAPGSALLKVPSSPQVYAVGDDGALHWVKSEDVLAAMVGPDWITMIRIIPESLLTDYAIGSPIGDLISYQFALAQ